MTTPEAVPERKKSNKTLIVILAGCGGCLLLSGVGVIVGAIVMGTAAKKGMDEFSSGMIGLQVIAQEAALTTHLVNDTARTERVEKVYGDLLEMAEAGELQQSDVENLQKKVEAAEKDNKITGPEADEILDMAEDVVGG